MSEPIEVEVLTKDLERLGKLADKTGKQVAKTGSDAVDVAEQVVEHTVEVIKADPKKFVAIGAVGGILVGISAGYLFAKQRLSSKMSAQLEDEIATMREYYARKEDDAWAKKVEPEAKPDLVDVVEDLGYVAPVGPVNLAGPKEKEDKIEVTIENVNVFEGADGNKFVSEWDYSAELKSRQAGVPYVVHMNEVDEDKDSEREALTYFEVDDVLVDAVDAVLDQDETIGLANLNRFGHGSGDPNIVYIKNEEKDTIYEVIRSDRSYAEDVHGFSRDQLEHSDRRRSRRRDEDA